MCLSLEIEGTACGHTTLRTQRCSAPNPCRETMREQRLVHVGECTDCLDGHYWPPESYDLYMRKEKEASGSPAIKAYCQSLLDFMTFFLAHDLFRSFTEANAALRPSDQERDILMTLLRTYYSETQCLVCGEPEPPGGQPCACHPEAKYARRCNMVSVYRNQFAHEAYKTVLGPLVERHLLVDRYLLVEELEEARKSRSKDFMNPLGKLFVNHSWPLSSNATDFRHNRGIDNARLHVRAMKWRLDSELINAVVHGEELDEVSEHDRDGPREEVQQVCNAFVMSTSLLLAAYDPGLADADVLSVARWVAGIAPAGLTMHWRHISVRSSWRPDSWRPDLDYTAYEEVMGMYISHFKERTVPRFTDEVQTMIDKIEYIWAETAAAENAKKTNLMTARLCLYATATTSEELLLPDSTEWFCFVCHEAEHEEPGGAVTIKRCGHALHAVCLLRSVLERPGNNRLCPYCNQSFDGLPNTEVVDQALHGEMDLGESSDGESEDGAGFDDEGGDPEALPIDPRLFPGVPVLHQSPSLLHGLHLPTHVPLLLPGMPQPPRDNLPAEETEEEFQEEFIDRMDID